MGGVAMRSPKLVAAAAAALLISWSLSACSSQGTSGTTPANSAVGSRITMAMVTHGQSFDPFWSLVQKGAQTAAKDFNVALKYQSPSTTNPQAQASLITQAARTKPDAMVVTIPDPAVLSGPIRQVSSSGIPAGVRKALCVIHEAQNTALTDRCSGFSKQLSASGGSVQVLHVNGSQLHQAQSAIEQALKRSPSINGVLATGIIGFEAAGGALQTMNLFGKVKFGTFDVSAADLTAVENGQALFVIDQQPFLEGYAAVQVAAFDVRYGQHPFQPIFTGPSLVTKANAGKVAKLYKNTGVPLFQGG